MNNRDKVIFVVLCGIVLIGMVTVYFPTDLYNCEFSAKYSDDSIEYSYDANYGMETHTALIETDGKYDINTIIACYDEGYYSSIEHRIQKNTLGYFDSFFENRELHDFRICSASEIPDVLKSLNPYETALMFVSAEIPQCLYNGTEDCFLVDWLDSGGAVINMFGCFGKYVATSSTVITVEGFAEIFTGVDDDTIFRDGPEYLFGDVQDSVIQEALGVFINECTYGIKYGSLTTDYFRIGSFIDGYSSALLFESRNGMIMNFSVSREYYAWVLQPIAQIVASGLDYSSEILNWDSGDTRNDNSGSFSTDAEHCQVYGYVGNIDATYGKKIIIR